ncbi:MAG TPA: hypothetical protein VD948_02835 [Rhodothermales bacterium]|nr:hypothetical protein [Rhodothermales bacterium]
MPNPTEVSVSAATGRLAFANLLKDDYGPRWEDHVHKEVVIWSLIAKERGKMGGKRTLTAVVSAFPQSAGIALVEDATLPTPRSLTAFNPILYARDIYTRLRWTGQVERAARAGDKMAWAKPRMAEIALAQKQFNLNVARMAYVGYYNVLSRINTVGGSNNQDWTMYSRNDRTSAAADFWKFGTHYLRLNQSVNVVGTADVSGDLVGTSEQYIDNIAGTIAAPTASIDGDIGATDPQNGDFVVPWASRQSGTAPVNTDASTYAGINGLSNLMLDSNIYSHCYDLARSSNPTLSGARLTNSGTARAFDEMYCSLLMDRIADEGIGEEPDAFVFHRSFRREIIKDNKENRRFTPVVAQSGVGKLQYVYGDQTIPYTADRDCFPGIMFGLKKGMFGWLSNSPMGPIDDVGERWVADKDSHEVIMHMAGNIFCTVPISNGSLEDITFDVSEITTTP